MFYIYLNYLCINRHAVIAGPQLNVTRLVFQGYLQALISEAQDLKF